MGYQDIILKQKKFNVTVQGNSVTVLNTRTGFYIQHNIHEFIYGQMGYNDDTEKYPDYVHGDVWRQWESNRKNQKKG
jgi:hypothetical protein